MSETYSVVLTGRIIEGVALAQVKANVASLFKLGDEQVEKMFVGKPVVVRKGVALEQAEKISTALTKAGAIAVVKQHRPESAEEKPESDIAATQPDEQASAATTDFAPDLECPRCGHHQPFATSCSRCKMDLRLHIQRLQRRERVRAARRQADKADS